MKFAKTLQSEVVLEWSTKYIDYKGLKGKLRAVEREKHRLSSTTFRRSIETDRSYADGNHGPNAPENSTSIKHPGLFMSSSQRAMSLTSIAESTGSLLTKVSSILTNWRKHSADSTFPEHNPTPIVITSYETLMLQVNPSERDFFTMVDKELEKVNSFYESKEKESIDLFEVIKRQYSQDRWAKQSTTTDGLPTIGSPDERQQKEMKYKDAKKLIKKALFETYRGTELLKKYRALNQKAFSKILKKYDKIANVSVSKLYMSRVNRKNFIKSSKLESLIRDIEDFYSIYFGEGSRKRSMRKLRIPSKKNIRHYSSIWKTGIYLGMALPLFAHSIYLTLSNNQEIILHGANTGSDSIIPRVMQLYTGMGIVVILMLLLGVNMYVWTRARINYKFIFEFDPRDNIDYHQYLEIPSLMFLAISFFMYITIENILGIYQEQYPRILLILILAIVFMPLKIFYYNARRWFIFTMARIIASPFTSVEFRDFFVADELTSLAYSFVTLQLFLCTCKDTCESFCFTSNSLYTPMLASIPAFFRSLQCLRRLHDTRKSIHLINVGKYFSIIFATHMLFLHRSKPNSHFRTFWVTSQFVNSIYTFLWDIKMDWRLFQHSSNLFLRDQLAYRRKWVYYYSIAGNFLLRFSWILILTRDVTAVGLTVAIGELLRRWIWNFFRVENEHANNCVKSRAIGIDKIIDKLVADPIIDEKDLGDFSSQSVSMEEDRWKDFESRNGNVQYEYFDDDDDDDDEEDEDSTDKDDYSPRRYMMSVDVSNKNVISYASRRLPISMSDINEEVEGDNFSIV